MNFKKQNITKNDRQFNVEPGGSIGYMNENQWLMEISAWATSDSMKVISEIHDLK